MQRTTLRPAPCVIMLSHNTLAMFHGIVDRITAVCAFVNVSGDIKQTNSLVRTSVAAKQNRVQNSTEWCRRMVSQKNVPASAVFPSKQKWGCRASSSGPKTFVAKTLQPAVYWMPQIECYPRRCMTRTGLPLVADVDLMLAWCWSIWVQVTCSPSARQSLTNWRACKAKQSYTWAALVKYKAYLLNVGKCWKSVVVNSSGNRHLPCTLKNARKASEETSKAPPSQEGKDSQIPQRHILYI